MGDFHGFRGRGRSDAKHCKFLQLPAPYLTGKEVEKLMEAARAPPKADISPPCDLSMEIASSVMDALDAVVQRWAATCSTAM
jgi:hypothetical protein